MNADEYIASRAKLIEEAVLAEIPGEPEEVYGMLREFVARGGKRIRPVLTLASCSACGGDEGKAMPFAVAVELFHNFTLIHDDIEDSSPMRRGKPTLHMQYGIPMALNAGDALYNIMWSSLFRKVGPEELHGGAPIMLRAFRMVAEGQGMELSWYRDKKFDVSEEDYLRMVEGKTAALIGASCELGACAADAEEGERGALREFGEKTGLAFQIRDDVLNLTADPSKYRKKIGEDVEEGKRSLIVIHLLSNSPEKVGRRVAGILGKARKGAEEVGEVIALAKEYGSVEYASEYAERLVREAKRSLRAMGNAGGREMMEALGDYIVEREK
ncbi:MAG: polyprenyl synthetase family protein [Candidatus Micrarchaeota archaeon]